MDDYSQMSQQRLRYKRQRQKQDKIRDRNGRIFAFVCVVSVILSLLAVNGVFNKKKSKHEEQKVQSTQMLSFSPTTYSPTTLFTTTFSPA